MSSRRRRRRSSSSLITATEETGSSENIDERLLVLKLQALVPDISRSRNIRYPDEVSAAYASVVVKEACNHILKLQRQVDDLSKRLCNALDSISGDTVNFDDSER